GEARDRGARRGGEGARRREIRDFPGTADVRGSGQNRALDDRTEQNGRREMSVLETMRGRRLSNRQPAFLAVLGDRDERQPRDLFDLRMESGSANRLASRMHLELQRLG